MSEAFFYGHLRRTVQILQGLFAAIRQLTTLRGSVGNKPQEYALELIGSAEERVASVQSELDAHLDSLGDFFQSWHEVHERSIAELRELDRAAGAGFGGDGLVRHLAALHGSLVDGVSPYQRANDLVTQLRETAQEAVACNRRLVEAEHELTKAGLWNQERHSLFGRPFWDAEQALEDLVALLGRFYGGWAAGHDQFTELMFEQLNGLTRGTVDSDRVTRDLLAIQSPIAGLHLPPDAGGRP